jgi:hypothetical protein
MKVSTSEVAPVCAVLGGIIGNEVIKAISVKGEPANNTCCSMGYQVSCGLSGQTQGNQLGYSIIA